MLSYVSRGRQYLTALLVILLFSNSLGAAMGQKGIAVHPFILPSDLSSSRLEREGGLKVVIPGSQQSGFPSAEARTKPAQPSNSGRCRIKLRHVGLTVGLALAGGVLALWSKARADSAYDQYNTSANRQRQDHEFARAEAFDRLAGSGLLIMELGVALTAYVVFF